MQDLIELAIDRFKSLRKHSNTVDSLPDFDSLDDFFEDQMDIEENAKNLQSEDTLINSSEPPTTDKFNSKRPRFEESNIENSSHPDESPTKKRRMAPQNQGNFSNKSKTGEILQSAGFFNEAHKSSQKNDLLNKSDKTESILSLVN